MEQATAVKAGTHPTHFKLRTPQKHNSERKAGEKEKPALGVGTCGLGLIFLPSVCKALGSIPSTGGWEVKVRASEMVQRVKASGVKSADPSLSPRTHVLGGAN